MIYHTWKNAHGSGAIVDRYQDLPDSWPGSEEAICVLLAGAPSITAPEIMRLKQALDATEARLGDLVPPLLDALRNAADLDAHTIYDLLTNTGIIRREPYDPAVHGGYADWEAPGGPQAGEEIWVLTELGERFARKEG